MRNALPLSQWSKRWRGQLRTIYVDTFLSSVDCGPWKVSDLISACCYGVFAPGTFGQCMVVGYYFGLLIYIDPCRLQDTTLTYCEQLTEVTRETFQKWENYHKIVVDKDNVKQTVWIVPALFCAMPYSKGGRYLTANEDQELEHVRNVSKNSVKFFYTCFPDGPADSQSH